MSSQIVGRSGGQRVAPSDARTSGTKTFDRTDKTLRDIPPIATGDIQCSPKSAGAGTSDRTGDYLKQRLP
jgi:hypothetical protein